VRIRTRRFLAQISLPFAVAAVALADAPPAPAPEAHLVDRVVAVVDEAPILLSDIERVIGLGLIERREGESPEALRRRTLDELIVRRLRQNEVERFGYEEAPLDQVEAQVERLRSRFADEAAWQARLVELGFDEAQVRQILATQLAVLTYLEQRLGPRAFVGLEEIRRYYDETLVPKLRAQGDPVPPIEEVREAIRAVLREEKLDHEIDVWTDDLRREADVIDLLDQPERALPPVRLTFDKPPG